MKGIYSKYLSKEEWLIHDNGWSGFEELHAKESIFTLGNGYLGSRGIYEESPDGTDPGTYIAGVYDKAGSMVSELVNAPNPIDIKIAVEGEKLDFKKMNVIEHDRVLDMKQGLLVRRTVFSDTKNRRFLYESIRFFGMHDNHIGCMQVCLKALDKPARILVQDSINDSVTNTGSALEGRKRHTQIAEVSTTGDMNYLSVKTFTSKTWIAYGSFLGVARWKGQGVGTLNKIFNLSLAKGETACFTKIFSIYTSRHLSHKKIKKQTLAHLRKAVKTGFYKMLEEHGKEWGKKWQAMDVTVQHDKDTQKALRFNIYHLAIAGKKNDENVSVGAKTLSGDGYRGHVFWDTEIFMLPFFIYTEPAIARNLLMYRYHRLDAARKIASEKGYRGALFPWESAASGFDVTPPYAKNLDGTITEIHTMAREHHITSDVAYGVWHYFTATADEKFMLRAGFEIIFEAARFWASRVSYNKKTKKYDIKNVIGPNEFQENVNNNAYTNGMAIWNLRKANEFFVHFSKKYPRFLRKTARRLSLDEREAESWLKIAENIKINRIKSEGVIEEFDGFSKKRKVMLDKLNNFFMPILPNDISLEEIQKTQLIKQADVVMLQYLLPDNFTEEEKKRTYIYYIKRTAHKSSLSPSIYAIMGSEAGDSTRAYLLFLVSLYADLKNAHGNTADGIHAASLGGTWQAVVMGFAGFRIMNEMPSFEPRLPNFFKRIKVAIKWKGASIKASLTNKRAVIFIEGKSGRSTFLKCFNTARRIGHNKKYVFLNKGKEVIKMSYVRDVMTKEIVAAKLNDKIQHISKVLSQKKISNMPVVNNKGEIAGIVSEKDIIDAMESKKFMKMTAKDIMTKKIKSVKESDCLAHVAKIFMERPYRRLPVTRKKKVVGSIDRKTIINSFMGNYY